MAGEKINSTRKPSGNSGCCHGGAEARFVVEDYFEEEEEEQQASAEAAMTNTGQRTRLRSHVLLAAKERAQCARCDVGLCVVPCFA
jgi:hypothetical protein